MNGIYYYVGTHAPASFFIHFAKEGETPIETIKKLSPQVFNCMIDGKLIMPLENVVVLNFVGYKCYPVIVYHALWQPVAFEPGALQRITESIRRELLRGLEDYMSIEYYKEPVEIMVLQENNEPFILNIPPKDRIEWQEETVYATIKPIPYV